jgi:hypothetical protein
VRTIDRHGIHAARSLAHAACILALALLGSHPVSASTAYGDLNNFDTFNDTGHDCYGFEIELDDIHSTDITYTYDYNHYGPPVITEDNSDPNHPKVFVRYAAKYDSAAGRFLAFTSVPASPPAPTMGHQCTDPSVNIGCEHFGVGHYGAPTLVTYNWLIENPSAPGTLIRGPAVNVTTPTWTYYPPAGGQPAQVQAVIPAPPPPPAPVYEFGDACWVKSIVTTSHNNAVVELKDLVSDDPDDTADRNWANGEPDEVEVEWQILQEEFNNPGGANNDLAGGMEGLPNGDEVITRRYEFYKYVGPFDTETNEAICGSYPAVSDPADPKYKPECDPATVTILGDYIGAQMAGFNVVAPLGLIDNLQDGDITQPYTPRTVVVGGNTPYVTGVTLGALPPGMSLDSQTGILSGDPFPAGDYSFTLSATDADSVQVTRAYTMKVIDPSVVPVRFLLSVAKAGVGSGTVTGGSIDCGATCTALLDSGLQVTLTAAPDATSVFAGWSGDCAGTGSCEIVIDGDRNVTATFDPCAQSAFYQDADNDGFGDAAHSTMACTPPAGYVADASDCNDADGAIHPGAVETCNLADDNCNGTVDEGGIPAVTIDVPDSRASELHDNTGTLRFTRSGGLTVGLGVTYSAGGTATPGLDYRVLTGNAIFPAGKAAIQVRVRILDDSIVEPIETVIATLIAGPDYSVGPAASGTVQIKSNE